MRRLCDRPRWVERREFFGWCTALERQGEALIVVPGLPGSKGRSGRVEIQEAVPAPELFVVDPMAPLDFAVLLRPPGPNVPVPDPRGFDPQHEGEGELLPVVTLQLFDGEREGPPQLREKGQTRAGVQSPVEPQHAEARTVVQGGVLKDPAPRDRYVLHVDLNRFSWL